MKKYFLLLLPLLSGCFKDEPGLTQYYAKQEIDIAVDSLVCFSTLEDFDFFIISNSLPLDSMKWYSNYANWQGNYLGNDTFITIPVALWSNENIGCVGYSNGTRIEYIVNFYYCARFLYMPLAFTPDGNGINDKWFPIFSSTYDGINFQSYSIHWEIRTLDGLKVFEADDIDNAWDGRYNGYQMPHGVYLYYIELTISGEDPVEYTGWIEMLG